MNAPLKDGQPVPCTLVNGIYVPHDYDPRLDAELARIQAGMNAAEAGVRRIAEPMPKPFHNMDELNREVEEHRAIAARRVRAMGYKP